MKNPWIWPMLAMVIVTLMVWLRMYAERLGQMKRERIHPQAVASSAQMYSRLADTRAADNFRNLFELPVLFYAALLFAQTTAVNSFTLQVLAWGFVLARVVHSVIHCSYNRVMHRFTAYVAGGVLLWAMWAVLLVNWW